MPDSPVAIYITELRVLELDHRPKRRVVSPLTIRQPLQRIGATHDWPRGQAHPGIADSALGVFVTTKRAGIFRWDDESHHPSLSIFEGARQVNEMPLVSPNSQYASWVACTRQSHCDAAFEGRGVERARHRHPRGDSRMEGQMRTEWHGPSGVRFVSEKRFCRQAVWLGDDKVLATCDGEGLFLVDTRALATEPVKPE